MELIETSTFTKQITALLGDDEYRKFQFRLPRIHSSELSSRVAVGYARFAWRLDHEASAAAPRHILGVRRDSILLLYAYPKNVVTDLTAKQVSQLARVVKEEFGDEKGDD